MDAHSRIMVASMTSPITVSKWTTEMMHAAVRRMTDLSFREPKLTQPSTSAPTESSSNGCTKKFPVTLMGHGELELVSFSVRSHPHYLEGYLLGDVCQIWVETVLLEKLSNVPICTKRFDVSIECLTD